jgi:hypothetical protein
MLDVLVFSTCDVDLNEWSEMFGTKFSTADYDNSSLEACQAYVGPLSLHIYRDAPSYWPYRDGNVPWKFAMRIVCHPLWVRTRLMFALELMQMLHTTPDSCTCICYDMASPLILMQGGDVLLDISMKDYYSNVFSPGPGHSYCDIYQEYFVSK